jgi:hypothetical protein
MEYIIAIIAGLAILGFVGYKIWKKRNNEDSESDVIITPDTSGRKPMKKALLVGINKYRPDLNADLRGCVNDVENMRDVLIRYFGFATENIRVVIDDRATKAAMIERLRWLLNGAAAGDELVFHYSGHGSQVRDRNGDELDDQLDEILCPHDMNWDDPFTDDTLGNMFKQLPNGVFLTMVCDSCHSGTMTRTLGNPGNPHDIKPRFIMPPFDVRCRSLNQILPKRKMGKSPKSTQRHVLLSGCKDNQTSADAFINNKYQGALTWAFTTVVKSNPNLTWPEIHQKVLAKLNGYTQEPQLSGDNDLLNRKIFGGSSKS